MSVKMTQRQNLFNETSGFSPDRNFFDLSHRNISAFEMGKLYPVSCFEVLPGDSIDLKAQFKLRFNALLCNPYSNIKIKFRSFFVPYRIMWKKWRNFITGGRNGDYVVPIPHFNITNMTGMNLKNTLPDYLGFPVLLPENSVYSVNAFPFVAYDFIYYWYFINQHLQDNLVYNIQDELGVNPDPYLQDDFYMSIDGAQYYTRLIDTDKPYNKNDFYSLYNVNWERDYFTSAFKTQQLGSPVAIPISSIITDNHKYGDILGVPAIQKTDGNWSQMWTQVNTASSTAPLPVYSSQALDPNVNHLGYTISDGSLTKKYLEELLVSNATFNVNDLRLAFATQVFQEGLLLGGYEYNDFLNYFFGKSPTNLELQKPYFIGGFNSSVMADDIFQTSQSTSDSSLGDFGGVALGADAGDIGQYNVEEYGLIMTLMYIVPSDISQSSQGINKMWMRENKFDYYNPAFANLSEQPVYNYELYVEPDSAGLTAVDKQIFGFQGNYNEYRYIPDYVTSDMRDTLSYMHLARIYANRPVLNEEYIRCNPSNRIFAVQMEDVPQITGVINNQVYSYRVMPSQPVPGLIDHRY